MTRFKNFLQEKRFALFAAGLVFAGFFFLNGSDSLLFALLKGVLFIVIIMLLLVFNDQAKAKRVPEPPDEEDFQARLATALAARRQEGERNIAVEPAPQHRPGRRQNDPEDLRKAANRDFDTMINHLLSLSRSSLAAENVAMYVLNPQEKCYDLRHQVGSEERGCLPHVDIGNSLLDAVVNEKRIVMETAIPAKSGAINYLAEGQQEMQSFLGAPLFYRQQAIGLLLVDSPLKENFSDDDKEYLRRLAETISTGIQNTDRLYETATLARDYETFDQLHRLLARSLTQSEIMENISTYLQRFFAYDRLVIARQQDNQLTVEKVAGLQDVVREGQSFATAESLSDLVVRQQKALLLGNVDREGGYTPRFHKREPHGRPLRSFLGVPLVSNDESTWLLTIEGQRSDQYKEKDRDSLQSIASELGWALRRANLIATLDRQNRYDKQSGFWNARGFYERIGEEAARSQRYKHALSLLRLRPDEGAATQIEHQAQLRSELMKMLGNAIREVDIGGRSKDGDLLILLPATDQYGAKVLAERLRVAVAAKHFYIEGKMLQTTISLAIGSMPEHVQTATELPDMLLRTLHSCILQGGNCTLMFSHKRDDQAGKAN
jgi:GAF domain-containing protein